MKKYLVIVVSLAMFSGCTSVCKSKTSYDYFIDNAKE